MQFLKRTKLTQEEKNFLSILYTMYSGLMWYVSVKILKDRGLAEDAMQQSFEKIIKKAALLRGFQDIGKVKQYMYVVTKNTALKIMLVAELFPEPDASPDPVAEEVLNRIEIEELRERVRNMNPTYGEAFFLRYFLELDYDEIADALSISVSIAQRRVSKAKALLRAGKAGEQDAGK